MDLIAAGQRGRVAKTREVLEEEQGGILFVDETYTRGMTSKRWPLLGASAGRRARRVAGRRGMEISAPSTSCPRGFSTPSWSTSCW